MMNWEYFEAQKADTSTYDTYLRSKKENILSDDQWDLLTRRMRNIRAEYTKKATLWMDRINAFRNENPLAREKVEFLRSRQGYCKHLELVTKPLLSVLLGDNRKFYANDFSKFELFVNVFNQYLIDLDLGQETATENDIIDVFNMIYVTPIDKYWTHENKWLSKIKQVGMAKYLFSQNE